MGKGGIGNIDNDLNVYVKERGTEGSLVVEVVDANGDQITNFTSTTPQSGNDTINGGSQTIVVSNTAIQLSSSSVLCKKVLIQANKTNRGQIWIGGSSVQNGSGGFFLSRYQAQWFTPSNLNLIYINGTLGEGVGFVYEN